MSKHKSANGTPVFRLYFTSLQQVKAFQMLIKQKGNCNIDRIYINADLFVDSYEQQIMDSCILIRKELPGVTFWLAMPPVLRNDDSEYLEKMIGILDNPVISGILCGNLEGIGYFSGLVSKYPIISDHHFYLWNREAVRAFDTRLKGACLPLELGNREQKALLISCEEMQNLNIKTEMDDRKAFGWDKIIYGRIPFMFTANCIAKTGGECRKNQGKDQSLAYLKDRMGTDLPVLINCRHCFNIIFNSIPLSLHGEIQSWSELAGLRLNFTTEDFEDTKKITNWFLFEDCNASDMPFKSYTNGNEKKGVL